MSTGVGYIAAGIAVVFFGSNFVPIKRFETGDGLFFQWVLCSAIWIAGLIVNLARGSPVFEPLAMLGGFLWCCGNICVVPIVRTIGLSLGMLLWGVVNLVMGWSSGNFGLFGLTKDHVSHPALNYVGVGVAMLATVVYAFVKTDARIDVSQEKAVFVQDEEDRSSLINDEVIKPDQGDLFDRMDGWTKRAVGISLSVVSGTLYGFNFDPPQYLMDHGRSPNGLDYVFSHFTGIFATSTFFFLVYCAIKKNKPAVYPMVILPAFASGLMWAVAQICWFIANEDLELVIAFPIISTGPGVVASLWGVLAFKEITGLRNFLILGGAFFLTFTGVALISLSKVKDL